MNGMQAKIGRFVAFAVVGLFFASLSGCGGSAPGASTDEGTSSASSVSRLSVALDSYSVSNSGSDTVDVTVTAVDSAGNAVADAPITVSVDNGAIYVPNSTTTSASGTVTGVANIGDDKSNRVITLTAKTGSVTQTAAFTVTGSQLAVSGTPNVSASSTTSVTFKLTDTNGNALPSQKVTVTASGFNPATATGVTNGSGEFVYTGTAPSTLGVFTINGTAGGVTNSYSITVGTGTIPDQASSIRSATLQVNPATLKPSSSSITSSGTVRLLVLGDNNVPLQNVRVRFSVLPASPVYGTVSSGADVVYTDASGVATTTFTASTIQSPSNGVTVQACYSGSDFTSGTCPNVATATLTVAQQALSVAIGFDNTITNGQDGLTYIKKYAVVVSDAAGNAVANAPISVSAIPSAYYKGYYASGGSGWAIAALSPACANEDVNLNGSLDSGEDLNSNGILDPRIPLTVTLVNSVTNSSGYATLQIEYPESYATWVAVNLTASVQVSGSEGRYTLAIDPLPALASDVTNSDVAPAFVNSPFGTAATCP